ncbi:diacylglycerol/lipid kinase family protein [Taibaiella soli]|uniref:Diacylglycerol kinase family lipid kinase n=1 Tax=Taibaiella soli TaxID=1649169 RepID=A0A2W2BYC2_9BACT|nr:diacylglycerol kinase family protein [Taibaiella soli]PZF72863.1 diacylglycerol kinase family lipid kinase [Taibaiella soli]
MSKKHLVFVVNPKSGVERQKVVEHAIEQYLDKEQFSYEIQHTQYAKHGTELAREAAKAGAYGVVAVGGDGSANDIAAGLLGTDTVLAIFPKGSGNGMARTMEIPLKDREAIETINRNKVVKMDVGFVNGQMFISNAGVGFDALIAKKFAKSARRGLMVYSWLVTKYLWLYNEWDWRIIVDGKEIKTRAFLINIANGRQFGYNFQIAPDADWQDGLLDVIVIKKFPKILGSSLVIRAMNGTLTKSPFVEHYRGKEITIVHPDLKLMQTDGDAHPCTNRLEFKIQAAAQKVIVP